MNWLFIKTKPLFIYVAFFLVFIFIGGVYSYNRVKQLKRDQLISQTSYAESNFGQLWPLPSLSNDPTGYAIRIVVEPGFTIGHAEFNDLVIRAWSYGFFSDSSGKIQRIAIPRIWENPLTKEIYFLSSTKVDKVESYSDKFLVNQLTGIDEILRNGKQSLANVFFTPNDPDTGSELMSFYKSLSSTRLPTSFLQSGEIKDLPKAKSIGTFLPATQLLFDLKQK